MSILGATLAALAALVVWAVASPAFGHRLVAVCRLLQVPAGLVLAAVTFYGGMWALYLIAPAGVL